MMKSNINLKRHTYEASENDSNCNINDDIYFKIDYKGVLGDISIKSKKNKNDQK
jgi:hypothetical protein